LKCSDVEDFVGRFAPNVTRGGIFLPTREARDVGASIRFELTLLDETVVFAGEGVVTWAKPKGMGVTFTTLDPATAPVLERLLSRRQAAPAATATATESSAATQATPAAGTPVAAPPVARAVVVATQPIPAALPASPAPEVTKTRSLVRPSVALATAFVCVGVALVSISVGRARVDTRSSSEPTKPVAGPAVEIATPPPVAAPEAPPPAPAPAPVAARATNRGGLQVERILVGASYKGFTCPNPTSRLSVKSSRTVNVCLQVAHKPGRAERLTVIWERNGAFSGKTPLQMPAARSNIRTRARMRISGNRLGAWSVRVVSDRDTPLAQTTFDVVP